MRNVIDRVAGHGNEEDGYPDLSNLRGRLDRQMIERAGHVDFERLLDSDEAAELLGIHPKTLQKMARLRQGPAIKVGDLWKFRASTLDAWVRTAVYSPSPLVP